MPIRTDRAAPPALTALLDRLRILQMPREGSIFPVHPRPTTPFSRALAAWRCSTIRLEGRGHANFRRHAAKIIYFYSGEVAFVVNSHDRREASYSECSERTRETTS
jgi:hypothetical protein